MRVTYTPDLMCFSSTASFVAGTALTAVGITAIVNTRKTSALYFTSIPFLFAIQQFSEGVLWLALGNQQYAEWERPSLIIFLLFAQVIWPVWVPWSILNIETDKRRKNILRGLTLAGALFAVYAGYCMAIYPVSGQIVNHHITYTLEFRDLFWKYISTAVYLSATTIPLFMSSVPRVRTLGYTIAVSFIVSVIMYPQSIISVWCYFAAILSIQVLYATVNLPTKQINTPDPTIKY